VSQPIEGLLSWSVIRVDAVDVPEEVTFEDAREDIQRRLAEDLAAGKMFDALDAFETARGDGLGMVDAAREAGVFAMSYDAVDQRGFDRDGVRAPRLAGAPEILQNAFESPVGFETELIEVGEDGYVVLRVDEVEPSAVMPLEEVRDRVRADLIGQRAEERLQAMGAAAREALEAGADLADAAARATPQARVDFAEIGRADTTPDVTRQLAAQAFGLEPGGVAEGRSQDGALVLVRLGEIVPTPEPTAEQIEAAQEAIQGELTTDAARLLADALQDEYDVRVNRALFATAVGAHRDH
jgi:peptidyl-prolyl cis-trans isomerase D